MFQIKRLFVLILYSSIFPNNSTLNIFLKGFPDFIQLQRNYKLNIYEINFNIKFCFINILKALVFVNFVWFNVLKIRDILCDFINWLEFYFDKHLFFSIHKTGVLQQILIRPQYLNQNDIVIFIKLWFTHDRILHQLEDVNYGKRSGLRMKKALHFHLEEVVAATIRML